MVSGNLGTVRLAALIIRENSINRWIDDPCKSLRVTPGALGLFPVFQPDLKHEDVPQLILPVFSA